MPAPKSAYVLTDDDLKAIAARADPTDLDVLSDEEFDRLDKIMHPQSEQAKAPAADTATERKFTQAQPVSDAPKLEAGPQDLTALLRAASQQPLAGKPTLAEWEASKSAPPKEVSEQVQMTLPSYATKFGADAPPLPEDGLSTNALTMLALKSALSPISPMSSSGPVEAAVRGFGKKLGAAAGSGTDYKPPPEQQSPPMAGETSLSDPVAQVQRNRPQQNATILEGQLGSLMGSTGWMTPYQKDLILKTPTFIGAVIPAVIEGSVESFSEFAFNPLRQAAQSPFEFGGNLAIAVSGYSLLMKAGNAASKVAELAKLEEVIASASPDAVAAYKASINSKLDDVSFLQEQLRVFDGDAELVERVRTVRAQIEDLSSTISKVRDKKILTENQLRINNLRTTLADIEGRGPAISLSKEIASENAAATGVDAIISDGAKAKVRLPTALSATPAGLLYLLGSQKEDIEEPGAPRASSPMSLKTTLFYGTLGLGLSKAFYSNPEFRQAVLEFMQISKKNPPNLEKVFETLIMPLLPNTPANGLGQWIISPITHNPEFKFLTPASIAGAAVGGFVGSRYGTDEISPGLATLGAAAGLVAGGPMVGSVLSKMFKTDLTFQQLYKKWFTEAAGMSKSAMEAKGFTMMSLDGRLSEIADTVSLYQKFDTPTQAVMHEWLAGNVSLHAVPEAARWAAAKTRLIFDELTLDLLSSGLVTEGVLADTLTTNLGTYLPRQFLRYELGERPTNKVQAWLTSEGKGWGYFSSQDYFKKRSEIPQDVLKALGEIRDRPGYLLGKRGTLTATDVEMGRYHRFLLSSPENSIPEEVLSEGLKSRSAYNRLRYEDRLANKADDLLRKQDVGEIPEVNYAPQIAQEAQQAAEAKFRTSVVPDVIPGDKASIRAAARVKAANTRADNTMNRAYEYLDPDTKLPKFSKADNGMDAATWTPPGADGPVTYWKMPDNPRYGLLKGQYVEHSVANDVMGMHEASHGAFGLLKAGLGLFKFNKAVYNPASQVRNMMSNAIFADVLAGVAPWRIDKWYNAGLEFATSGPMYVRSRKAGTYGGGLVQSDIAAQLLPDLEKSSGVFDYVNRSISNALGSGSKIPVTPAFFARWHSASEAHARLAVFTEGVEKLGMTDAVAAAFARRVIPDYREVPRWLSVYRNSVFGAPFISFTYKALPRMFESAVAIGNPKQLLRFWKYPFAMAAVNENSAYTMGALGRGEGKGVDDIAWRMAVRTFSLGINNPDSYNTFKKFLPGHAGGMQILIRHRDAYDRPNHADATWVAPWGDLGEGGKGPIGELFKMDNFPRQLEPANPWLQMAAAATTHKDSFTGKEIISPGQNPVMAIAQYIARTWGPSLFNPFGYGAQSVHDAFSQGPIKNPNVKSKMGAVMSDVVGVRSRAVDPNDAYKFAQIKLYKEMMAMRSDIRSLGRIKNADPEAEIATETLDKIMANRPSSKLARLVREYKKKFADFKELYKEPRPESSQKYLDAIKEFKERNSK